MCEQQLDLVTGLTKSNRKKIFSWLASLPEESAVDIFRDVVKMSFQIKEQHPGLPGKVNKYCAFFRAARKAGWDTVCGKGYRVAETKQFQDFSHLRQMRAANLIQKGRTPALRRKVLAYWGEVRELKSEGLGFRPIAHYLFKTRKVSVSATYLAKLWKEAEAND